MKLSKNVISIFTIYLVIYYLIPFLTHCFYPEEFDSIFKNQHSKFPIILVVFFVLIVLFLGNYSAGTGKRLNFAYFGRIFNNYKTNLIIALINLGLSVYFFTKYDLRFRHQESLGDTGFIMMVLFILRSYSKIFIFFTILKFLNKIEVTKSDKIILFIIFISLLLTLMSSLDIIFILTTLVLLVNRTSLLFEKRKDNFIKVILRGVMILSVGIVVIFIGNANKVGTEEAKESVLNVNNIGKIVLKTTVRLSIFYSSVVARGNDDLQDNEVATEALTGIFDNLNNRIQFTIGLKDNVRPTKAWSVNRMNYLQLYKYPTHPRTGSSPGLIGAMFYIPYFPMGFILILVFCLFVLRRVSKVIGNTKLSFIGKIFLTFFILPLLDNPLDYINFISPGFFYFFLSISMFDYFHKYYLANGQN